MSARGKRVAALLFHGMERYTRELMVRHWGCAAAVERTLTHLQEPDVWHRIQFFLSRQVAESALGDRLFETIPTQLPAHRMHDWVRCGNGIFHTNDFFLSTGDWSPLLRAVQDCPVLDEAAQLRAAELRYRNTACFEHYIRCKKEGSPLVRNQVKLDTTAKVEAYFERFVDLFQSIADHGFLPLRQARSTRRELDETSSVRRLFTIWGEKDVGIALTAGRGPVLLPGGKHRLAIARVLSLPEIPVRVGMLHVSWLRQLGPVPPGQWLEAIANGLAASFNPSVARAKSE